MCWSVLGRKCVSVLGVGDKCVGGKCVRGKCVGGKCVRE